MSTHKQRMISASDLRFRGFVEAPHEAKLTAMTLWLTTDVNGRREALPSLIAADAYPGEAATDRVETHLLMLDESGFLSLYQAEGSTWLQLERPLKSDRRGAVADCPPPPHDRPWKSMAVGGAGERARERTTRESAERAREWAEWEAEQERGGPPRRPVLLDAPPIGCPEHPNGRFKDCGPCGTARRRHDKWVAQVRYGEAVEEFERGQWDEEEPF